MAFSPVFQHYFYKHFPQTPHPLSTAQYGLIHLIARELTTEKTCQCIWNKLENSLFLLACFSSLMEKIGIFHTPPSPFRWELILPIPLLLLSIGTILQYHHHIPSSLLNMLSAFIGILGMSLRKSYDFYLLLLSSHGTAAKEYYAR